MIMRIASCPNALEYGVASGDRLDSIAWISASIELVAKTERGRCLVNSGIRTASSAYNASAASRSLVFKDGNPTIDTFVTSLPVPHVVGTRIKGHFFSGVIFPVNRSTRGVICFNANNLEMSITVPPPMPKIRLYGRSESIAAIIFSIISSLGSPAP